MANISLDNIVTKEKLTKRDILNIEIIHGKFSLSHRAGLSSLFSFFLSSDELYRMAGELDGQWGWLDEFVYGKREGGIMDKEEMENKFFLKTEASYYYKRLLTDDVMEDVCSEYAQKKALSSIVSNCKEYGQMRATALGNALASQAAVVKTQAIKNDTNIQLTTLRGEVVAAAAEQISDACSAAAE